MYLSKLQNIVFLIKNIFRQRANEKGVKGEIDPSETFPNKNDLPCQEINGPAEKWVQFYQQNTFATKYLCSLLEKGFISKELYQFEDKLNQNNLSAHFRLHEDEPYLGRNMQDILPISNIEATNLAPNSCCHYQHCNFKDLQSTMKCIFE